MKNFTKITMITALLFGAIVAISATDHSSGIAGETGSPGETTCAKSGCHDSYGLNVAGTGSIKITSSDMTNWVYVPGTTYHMSVTIIDSGSNSNNLFGFDLEALKVSDTNSIGTLKDSEIVGGINIINDTAKLLNATVNGKARANITHNGNNPADPGPTSFSFNFEWKAPAADSGYIKFYVAGVSADGSGDPSGDFVFSTSQLIYGPLETSIHDQIALNSFNIYPNPVNSNCNIRFASGTTDSKCEIQLFNLSGSLVQSASDLQIAANEITNFKIADNVASGVYLMRLTANGNTSTQKVIVSKD